MYLAMARVAHRRRLSAKSAYTGRRQLTKRLEHAAKFAELLGEVVTDSTKKNLQMRVEAETGATAGKDGFLQSVLRLLTLMQSMTLFVRWLAMRLVTARQQVC